MTLNQRWLHRNIAFVAQEPVLFQTSIKENILYGNHSAIDEQVKEAAQVANAQKFILKLPNKYEEIDGENGSSLSGGQRQRIAIDRAIIRNPRDFLADEVTSALDAESEKKVQISLECAMKDRASIIVSHRLSTIRNADIINVFERGRITERGTHEELIEKKGDYFWLVRRQLHEE